jgi:hypothetical protein
MNIKILKAALTGLVLSVSCFANAGLIEIGTSYGNGADSWIHSDFRADTNYGDSDVLVLRNDGSNPSGWHRKSYIRFDLSGNSESITAASFDLGIVFNTLVNNEASINNVWDFEIYGLLDSSTGNNWGENSITWNNAVGNNVGTTGFTSEFELLGSLSLNSHSIGERITLSNAALLNFINNDTDDLITLGLRRVNTTRTDSSFLFASKENLDYSGPNLSLSTASVPEPSTLAIFALGMIGLASRKFKK